MANAFCEKCEKTMNDNNFYTYKDGRKTEMCKKCLTMHIDNFNEETYLWLLEKMDVPYVPAEWNSLRDKAFAKDPNLNGMSVFGKYLSKMKLKQWNKYGWADTEALQQQENKRKEQYYQEHAEEIKIRDEMKKELKSQLEEGLISEAQYKTLMDTEEQNDNYISTPPNYIDPNNSYNENNFLDEAELADLAGELTHDDKLYLAMKWGRLYKPNEWVELEKQYNEMADAFAIDDPDSVNTLKLLCKTNLKANQAIDCGDVDGFQKLSKVSESLRKSANFMAVQNKKDKAGNFDSVCEIVLFCEKEGGFIPRHDISVDFDIADRDIKDMKAYNRSLIKEDPTVFKQIEQFIKKREIAAEMEEDAVNADSDGIIDMTDQDLIEYREHIEQQMIEDQENLESGEV